jgi:hypothetical protein
MATLPNPNDFPLDAREQLARIDQMHAMIEQALASAAKARQETRFGPFTLAFAGMGALAAFFAGGVAFAKVFLG